MQDDEMDELIEIENAYYEGDDLRNENPSASIELFIKVVDMETKRGDDVKWYGLKANIMKLLLFTMINMKEIQSFAASSHSVLYEG
jgi:hypothetical protein